MENEELKAIIVENLINYRKANKLTQLELAEKINYSDKAISKWERGEATPDIFILKDISQVYNISINELISKHNSEIKPKEKKKTLLTITSKNLITLLSFGLVWFIATVLFAVLKFFNLTDRAWLIFLAAIPISVLVVYIFSKIWGNNLLNMIFLTIFAWSFTTFIYVTFNMTKLWLLFIIMASFQVLILLWFFLKQEKIKILKFKKKKQESKEKENQY